MPRAIAFALALGAALAGIGFVFSEAGPAASSSCEATLVRYEWNTRAGGAPWMSASAEGARLEGYLYEYHEYVGDGRVNRSERVVLRAGRPEKIAWFSTRWGGSRLTVVGRRLDGRGSFSQRFSATVGAAFYPSGVRIPAPGCWELTLRTQGWVQRIVVKAVDPAPTETCDATPVGASARVWVVPARSGISGAWGWRTEEGGALLYVGGRTPEGGNTKVLWRSTRPGGQLVLRGTQLDGTGAFRQMFGEAVSPRGYWPSIVVVPNPGCWLLTVRISGQAGAAGIVVVHVLSG